jgi:hypothetical protein
MRVKIKLPADTHGSSHIIEFHDEAFGVQSSRTINQTPNQTTFNSKNP